MNLKYLNYMSSGKLVFKKIISCYNFLFNDYSLKLDKVALNGGSYVLYFRIKNSPEVLQVESNGIDKSNDILQLINSLDAYLCGIVQGLQMNGIYLKDLDFLLDYFDQRYNYKKTPLVLYLKGVDIYDTKKFILNMAFVNGTRKLSYKEIVLNPFLILGLSSNEAFHIGSISVSCFMDEVHA